MNANETSIARGQNSLTRSLNHLIPVNAALMASTHVVYTIFMFNAAKKTVYTPWDNAMSAAFTRTEWSKKISNVSEVRILNKVQFFFLNQSIFSLAFSVDTF